MFSFAKYAMTDISENCKDIWNTNRWFICRLCKFPNLFRGLRSFSHHKQTKHLSSRIGIQEEENNKERKNSLRRSANRRNPLPKPAVVTGKPGSYKCPICDHKASQKSNLKTHIMMKHTKKPRFHCDICKYATYFQSRLNVHKRVHTGEKSFACDYCGDFFVTSGSLKSHKQSLHVGVEKLHTCDICKKDFKRPSDVSTHMKIHTRPFECDVCGKRFPQPYILKIHQRTHTGEKPYVCPVCGKRSTQQTHHNVHLRTHTGEKLYECSKCPRRFTSQGHLRSHHKRVHDGIEDERRFKCDICAKTCVTKHNLNIHMRSHTKEKIAKCHFCALEFSYESSLKNHLRTHTGERPYPCPQCPWKFQSSGDRSVHVKRCHPSEPDPTQCIVCWHRFETIEKLQFHVEGSHNGGKPYNCEVCDESFRFEFRKHAHMRKHKPYEERPYQCKTCDSRFWSKTALKLHDRTHTGERPFKCSQCPMAFAQEINMLSHSKRMH